MSEIAWSFDILLAVSLLGLAWRAVTTPDLFKGVVLFIAFGTLMAVAWTRLDAADIALAEAAIGAGVTGALLLNSLAHGPPAAVTPRRRANTEQVVIVLLVSGFLTMLGGTLWQLPPEAEGLASAVEAEIERSGATNPVTAVLLNFRGYDTLLEIGVLLLAVIGAWSLGAVNEPLRNGPNGGTVLLAFVRTLVPLMIVVAAYLLWAGAKAPGGAFQAGAILGAAGIVLLVSQTVSPPHLGTWRRRAGLAIGFAAFLALGSGMMLTGRRFLEYPQRWAGELILLVETVLTLSIAVILVYLFAVGPREIESVDRMRPSAEEQPQ